MAKAPQPPVRTRRAIAATVKMDLPGAVPTDADQERMLQSIKDEETVDVLVPKAFTFTLDNHQPVLVAAGLQPMPKSWADHWFVKAQGVVAYDRTSH